MINNKIEQIIELTEIGLSFKEKPKVLNELDKIFNEEINLNEILEMPISTLLFFAINNASWDLLNYFIGKGADINFRADYKTHKQINSIEFAEILLQEIKSETLLSSNSEIKYIDRLEDSFDKGVSETEITMQEFYALKSQIDMLKQVIFIEEFLRKYKNINYYEFGYWGYEGSQDLIFIHKKKYSQKEFEDIIIECSIIAFENLKQEENFKNDSFVYYVFLSEYIIDLLSKKYGFIELVTDVSVLPYELSKIRLIPNAKIKYENEKDNEEIILKIENALQKIK